MKKILGLLIKGISISLSLFSIFIMIYDLHNDKMLVFENGVYSRMLLGAIIVGIGFSLPGLIYENENIPYAIKVLIHMGVGCAVFIVTGYNVGWFPRGENPWKCILIILIELSLSFVLWFFFLCHYKLEARKIDEQIRKLNEKKDKMRSEEN